MQAMVACDRWREKLANLALNIVVVECQVSPLGAANAAGPGRNAKGIRFELPCMESILKTDASCLASTPYIHHSDSP